MLTSKLRESRAAPDWHAICNASAPPLNRRRLLAMLCAGAAIVARPVHATEIGKLTVTSKDEGSTVLIVCSATVNWAGIKTSRYGVFSLRVPKDGKTYKTVTQVPGGTVETRVYIKGNEYTLTVRLIAATGQTFSRSVTRPIFEEKAYVRLRV